MAAISFLTGFLPFFVVLDIPWFSFFVGVSLVTTFLVELRLDWEVASIDGFFVGVTTIFFISELSFGLSELLLVVMLEFVVETVLYNQVERRQWIVSSGVLIRGRMFY